MALLEKTITDNVVHFTPSLIFFDIDGTLLDTEGHYSQRLECELKRLADLGVKLAIASGRPAIAAQFLFDNLPLTDAGLFCTGAEIYHPKQKQHIQTHCLSTEDIGCLYEKIKQQKLYCEFYTCDFYTAGNNKDIASIHSQHLRVKPKIISEHDFIQQNIPITKLLLGVNNHTHRGALEKLAADFPLLEFAFAHFLARPDWYFASVVSPLANKEKGFKQLLNYHNVSADQVMAFGDSQSDSVFIQQAGMGVAMGNANKALKELANVTTLSADEDGVAILLSKLLS